MRLDRCYSDPVLGMNKLLWGRFVVARHNLLMAWLVGDNVAEAQAACRTALNTWYAFARKYNQLRTDKEYYWPVEDFELTPFEQAQVDALRALGL